MKSIYALVLIGLLAGLCFANAEFPPPDDNDQETALQPALEKSCGMNRVTVTDSQDGLVEDAYVVVRDTSNANIIASGNTDSQGKFEFQSCGIRVDIKATKAGYDQGLITHTLIDCAQCGCQDDSDCPDNQQCVNWQCVDIPCDCGDVQNHQCVPYECCSIQDCGQGQSCQGNVCVQGTPSPGCSNDSDCTMSQFCNMPPASSSGTCDEVQAGSCGIIQNHTFIAYECGPGCPSCAEGYICVQNACVIRDISCPASGVVGQMRACTATEGNSTCANCEYELTDPGGSKTNGTTDGQGRITLPLGSAGNYTIALTYGGAHIRNATIKAIPKASGEDGEKPFLASLLESPVTWVGIIVILLAAAFLVFRKRSS